MKLKNMTKKQMKKYIKSLEKENKTLNDRVNILIVKNKMSLMMKNGC